MPEIFLFCVHSYIFFQEQGLLFSYVKGRNTSSQVYQKSPPNQQTTGWLSDSSLAHNYRLLLHCRSSFHPYLDITCLPWSLGWSWGKVSSGKSLSWGFLWLFHFIHANISLCRAYIQINVQSSKHHHRERESVQISFMTLSFADYDPKKSILKDIKL